MSRPTHYPEHLAFRVPAPVAETVAREARAAHSNPADFCRRLILLGLKAEGIEVRASAPIKSFSVAECEGGPLEPASGG